MTYWQARDLADIARAGEYQRIEGSSAWHNVFGGSFKYPVIENSRMQCFVRNGWVGEERMQSMPINVLRVTAKGHYAYCRYFARLYKMQAKRWEKIVNERADKEVARG